MFIHKLSDNLHTYIVPTFVFILFNNLSYKCGWQVLQGRGF